MLNILRKNKKVVLLTALFSVAILLLIANNQLFDNNQPEEENKITRACIKENCFDIEIADTAQERGIGLMNRGYLAPDSGMLFIFENEGVYNFWMKNTLIPLDMIWIDENNKIIYIEETAQPCKVEQCGTFGPNEEAKYVLEINGGMAEEMGFKTEDEVEFK